MASAITTEASRAIVNILKPLSEIVEEDINLVVKNFSDILSKNNLKTPDPLLRAITRVYILCESRRDEIRLVVEKYPSRLDEKLTKDYAFQAADGKRVETSMLLILLRSGLLGMSCLSSMREGEMQLKLFSLSGKDLPYVKKIENVASSSLEAWSSYLAYQKFSFKDSAALVDVIGFIPFIHEQYSVVGEIPKELMDGITQAIVKRGDQFDGEKYQDIFQIAETYQLDGLIEKVEKAIIGELNHVERLLTIIEEGGEEKINAIMPKERVVLYASGSLMRLIPDLMGKLGENWKWSAKSKKFKHLKKGDEKRAGQMLERFERVVDKMPKSVIKTPNGLSEKSKNWFELVSKQLADK